MPLPYFVGSRCKHDGASEFTIFHGANFFLDRGKLFFAGARGEDVAALFSQSREDAGDLRRRLAFSENDFGHAGSQGAMMIDFREAEIFEGHVAQTRDGIVGRELALAYLLEKFADGFSVHAALGIRHLALSIQPSRSRLAFRGRLSSGVGGA